MLNPGHAYEREKARQGYRTGMQWKVLLASIALAVLALGLVAILSVG